MPNQGQQSFLDQLLGDYFAVIMDDPVLDLGTKILYLSRAISEDCQKFLESLDKLYDPNLNGKAKEDNIELIRAFKLINDLCFNNRIQYEYKVDDAVVKETRSALDYCFGRLGSSIVPAEFETEIKKIINARIAELSENHAEEEIATQKIAREAAEEGIAMQTGWRTELGLPLEQQSQQNQWFFVENIDGTFFEGLDPGVRAEMLANADEVNILVNGGNIPFNSLVTLEPTVRSIILKNYEEVHLLVNLLGYVSFENLVALESPIVLAKILENADVITDVEEDNTIPFEDLVEILANVPNEILEGEGYAIQMIKAINLLITESISIDSLVALDPSVRTEILENASAVVMLATVAEADIKFDLVKLVVDHPTVLYKISESKASAEGIIRLVKNAGIPFESLVALVDRPTVFVEILKNSYTVAMLVKDNDIKFDRLIRPDLEPAVLAVVLANAHTLKKLSLDQNIAFEKLSCLSAPQLDKVLANPKSEESRGILKDLTTTSSLGLSARRHL